MPMGFKIVRLLTSVLIREPLEWTNPCVLPGGSALRDVRSHRVVINRKDADAGAERKLASDRDGAVPGSEEFNPAMPHASM